MFHLLEMQRKSRIDQTVLQVFQSDRKERIYKPSKVPAAENFFSNECEYVNVNVNI